MRAKGRRCSWRRARKGEQVSEPSYRPPAALASAKLSLKKKVVQIKKRNDIYPAQSLSISNSG